MQKLQNEISLKLQNCKMRERDIKSQGQKLAQVKLERQMDPEGHDSEVDESNPLHAVVAAR